MSDDEIYECVIKEIQEHRLDQATWARALIDSEGDQAITVARYIRLRTSELNAIRRTTRIALWNPATAAHWSLAFTPLFGAYIHMRNWQAMGEYKKARESKKWIFGSMALQAIVLMLAALLPFPQNAYFLGLGLAGVLVMFYAWYVSSARKQASYVSSHFGHAYKRNSWTEVIVIAFAVWLSIVFLMTAIVVSKFNNEGLSARQQMLTETPAAAGSPKLIPVTSVEAGKTAEMPCPGK